jgi:hypothetical protein
MRVVSPVKFADSGRNDCRWPLADSRHASAVKAMKSHNQTLRFIFTPIASSYLLIAVESAYSTQPTERSASIDRRDDVAVTTLICRAS